VTYDIEGMKAVAFAVEVGARSFASSPSNIHWARPIRLHFEIEVDGALKAQSGLMAVFDAPRLLVVNELSNAKTLTLRVRRANDTRARRIAAWADPVLYLARKRPPGGGDKEDGKGE
jgi:hypothetical protein